MQAFPPSLFSPLMKNTKILMLLYVFMVSSLFQLARSETSPYCRPYTCTVTCSSGLLNVSSKISSLIDGSSFKALVSTDAAIVPPAAGYLNYSKWFKIDQGSPRLVVTVYLLHFAIRFDQ